MTSDELAQVRARAMAAGLELDEARLETVSVSLDGIETMMRHVRMVPVDPTDLALEPYDPAWPEERAR